MKLKGKLAKMKTSHEKEVSRLKFELQKCQQHCRALENELEKYKIGENHLSVSVFLFGPVFNSDFILSFFWNYGIFTHFFCFSD